MEYWNGSQTLRCLLIVGLIACVEVEPEPAETPKGPRLLVLESDYSTGLYEELLLDSMRLSGRHGPSGGDISIGQGFGGAVILQRSQMDSLLILDENLEIGSEWPLPAAANVQDIQVIGDELFVAPYGLDHLIILDRHGNQKDRVDLSAYADLDGRPEISALAKHEDRLFVAIQNLDFSAGAEPEVPQESHLLIIDPRQRRVESAHSIPPNPFSDFVILADGTWLIVCNGSWAGPPHGGIYRFDPLNPEGGALWLSEAELGGDLASREGIAQFGGRLWMVVGNEQGQTRLLSYGEDDSSMETELEREDWSLGCVYSEGSELWLCDRRPGEHGLRGSHDHFQSLVSTRLAPLALLKGR